MPRGRKKKLDRPVRQVVYIPSSVMAHVELLLLDPVSSKLKHGALSELTTSLYRSWLAERNTKP